MAIDVGSRPEQYDARYRAEHCDTEIWVTACGIPSNVPPQVLPSDGYRCIVCNTPMQLKLVEVGISLMPIPDTE